MKIEKLYTLSQFVEELIVDTTEEQLKDEWWMSSAFIYITLWDKFLKQPLKKEMFVNAVRFDMPADKHEMDLWQQAEKKVIFKGWECESGTLFNKDCILDEIDTIDGSNTLEYLARYFNGELETQNIEL